MGLGSFNKQSRQGLFRILSGGTLDLLVIGGGITGASVFRDAALRGMSVALVEANDFASVPRPPPGAVPSSYTVASGTSRIWASALRGSPATNVTSTFGSASAWCVPCPFSCHFTGGRESH